MTELLLMSIPSEHVFPWVRLVTVAALIQFVQIRWQISSLTLAKSVVFHFY